MNPPLEPFALAQNDLFIRLSNRRALKEAGADIQQMRPRTEMESTAIINSLNESLAGAANLKGGARAGLAVLVTLPGFEPKQPNLPGVFGDMIFTVVVLENILINMGDQGTRMSCEEAAQQVMLAGHQALVLDGRAVTCESMRAVDVDRKEFSADIAYEVSFRCPAGFTQEPECALPLITVTDDSTLITCATANARIWLTTDGSMPHPDNPQAIPVSTAIETPAGPCILRAAAFRDDLNPSSPAWKRITA